MWNKPARWRPRRRGPLTTKEEKENGRIGSCSAVWFGRRHYLLAGLSRSTCRYSFSIDFHFISFFFICWLILLYFIFSPFHFPNSFDSVGGRHGNSLSQTISRYTNEWGIREEKLEMDPQEHKSKAKVSGGKQQQPKKKEINQNIKTPRKIK